MQQALAVTGIALLLALFHQIAWLATRAALDLAARSATRFAVSRSFIRNHPVTAWFAARFPRTYRLLAGRLATTRFTGLPLTLLVAAATYIVILFGGLIEELLEAEGLVRVDTFVDRLVGRIRTDLGNRAFLWITELGSAPTFLAVGLVAAMFLLIERRLNFVPALWTTLLGAQATTWIGKYAINRTRPEFLDIATAVTPSFPSGHATAAMAVYGFLAYIAVRRVRSPRVRFEVIYWTSILITLIGLSRIYLRVHFLTDVLSGFLVGGFWLLAGVVVAEWLLVARLDRR